MATTTDGDLQTVPRLTGVRAVRALVEMGAAAIASGVIVRRPPMMRLLEKVQADRTALACVRRLRAEFGRGPVELVLPGRRVLLILDPADVGRVLAESPEPFSPANREKRAALRPFQPHGVLISSGDLRTQRRVINVAALDTSSPLHRLAEPMAAVIDEEVGLLLDAALPTGRLDADALMQTWWKMVRRITLGDSARDDEETTDRLRRLRAAGNWSFLSRPHPIRRERFVERLYQHVSRAEPGSLAAALSEVPTAPAVDPIGQMPHWLFAFDSAGIVTSRALAAIVSDPAHEQRAADEARRAAGPQVLPFLRDCVLESVRVWPTTPTILRDTTADTVWPGDGGVVAAGAAVLIHSPVFHRDPESAEYADRFEPDIWSDGRADDRSDLVPFSAGPARCPGENLVLFVAGTFLASLLHRARFALISRPSLSPAHPMPLTLDNFGLQFAVEERNPA